MTFRSEPATRILMRSRTSMDGMRRLVVAGRRNFSKPAGQVWLVFPGLLQARDESHQGERPLTNGKSRHSFVDGRRPQPVDTWDPKPDRPPENRGPFGVINTRLPGFTL